MTWPWSEQLRISGKNCFSFFFFLHVSDCASVFSAHSTAPSGGHQAAVPMSTSAGRGHGQHPFTSLQSLSVPDLQPGHDRHSRTCHRVGLDFLLFLFLLSPFSQSPPRGFL